MGRSLEHKKTVAYVACADERKILACGVSLDTMEASVLQEVSMPGADGPSETSMPLALHPTKHVLYAAVRAAPFPVACFSIDPSSGRLQFCSSAQLADNTVFMQIDHSGQFLLTASYSDHTLSLYRLNGAGSVSSLPPERWETQRHPHSIVFDPFNRSFYVPCLGSDVVLNFGFDANKGLVSSRPAFSVPFPVGAGPRHQVLYPDGRYLFVLNELAGSITVLDLRMASVLPATVVQTVTLGIGCSKGHRAAADIRITPQGGFLYASERSANVLTAFAVDPDSGSLTEIGGWETEASPRSLAIDPTGRVLIAAGQQSNHVSIYGISGATGVLARHARLATPGNPSWVEIVRLPG